MDHLIGKRLDGRYQISELIGVGGMANVYKAMDLMGNRPVAVKILREEFLDNDELVRRFKNESKAISLLSHPNIVKVFDVNFSSAVQYIVMEFIDGITLKQYIDAVKPLGWKDAVYFAEQTLKALQHAHDRGIVHRDIKPQNIMLLEDGTIKVMDFGIARFSRSETRTVTDKAIGSVHYISPEQAKGDITDSKADLYSLGIMMYEMLTGTLPFESDTPVQVAIKQISDQARHPREIVENIPEGLEEITLKAMAKDSARRYQSAAQMLRDIDDFKRNPSIVFAYKYLSSTGAARSADRTGAAKTEAKTTSQKRDKKKKSRRPKVSSFVLSGVILASIVCTVILFLFMAGAFEVKHENVALPDFREMDINDVLNNPEYRGFKFGTPEEVYNANYPVGVIFDQSPVPGRLVKDNSPVILYVSMGPEEVELPDVVGMTSGEAKTRLRENNIKVRQESAYDPSKKANIVLSMNPGAGTVVQAGIDEVVIVVNVIAADAGAVPVPNVIGMPYDDAKEEIGKRTLRIGQVTLIPSNEPRGTVLEQSIEPGSIVIIGTAVDLVVSDGKGSQVYTQTITLPNGPSDGLGGYLPYTVRVTVNGAEIQSLSNSTATNFPFAFEIFADGTLVEVWLRYNNQDYLYIRYRAYASESRCDTVSGPTTPAWPAPPEPIIGGDSTNAVPALPQPRRRLTARS